MKQLSKVEQLLERGVIIPSPCMVEIGDEVAVEQIAPSVTLHAGSRIYGEKTWIGAGSIIGEEAPVTIQNCQLGRKVHLKGGFFSGAVFLDGANMGSGAHVRAGTLLEEEANGAHTVGLKQTILLPFVTLGSLINFCDILMAGGTSRKDHSEVGSSYIHFNFTAHQDKATASLAGDVPRGVFLRERPIFLGGQGGLVGPSRIAYGCVIAAGSVTRKDVLKENQLHLSGSGRTVTADYELGAYKSINRIVKNNLAYIGNILALQAWYGEVRQPLMQRDANEVACFEGACVALALVLEERLKRMRDLAEKMEVSVELLKNAEGDNSAFIAEQERLICLWPQMEESIARGEFAPDLDARATLLAGFEKADEHEDYLVAVQSLDEQTCAAGTRWLQSIVDAVSDLWTNEGEA
jgi:UDP-N-acetylglucosamine/UDP-N-acetylgalactosamine diphosphorylase